MSNYHLLILIVAFVLCVDAKNTLIPNTNNFALSSPARLISPNNTTQLIVQNNGSVVLSHLKTGKIFWTTNTAGVNGVAPYRFAMENNGNLVLSDANSNVFWSSKTINIGCAPWSLTFTDSLSIIDCKGKSVWSAGAGIVGSGSSLGDNYKKTTLCYEQAPACENIYGLDAEDLSVLEGIVNGATTVDAVFTGAVSYLSAPLTVFWVPSSYVWYSYYTEAALCSCTDNTFLIVKQ